MRLLNRPFGISSVRTGQERGTRLSVWHKNRPRLAAVLIATVVCGAAGCRRSGPELAPVTGVVTLDGKPVAGKQVSFSPKNFTPNTQSGRSSTGLTDEEGRYELFYTAQRKGALITTHTVTINTPEWANPPSPENIPERYRIDTILEAEVKDENNVIDFELTSDEAPESTAAR